MERGIAIHTQVDINLLSTKDISRLLRICRTTYLHLPCTCLLAYLWNNGIGCACDIPSALYSFSFALNPNWTKFTPPYREIRQYHEDVVESYGLRNKMTLCTEVYKCVWREDVSRWLLFCRNVETGQEFTHECRVLFGATGVLTIPQPCGIAGVESFKGDVFHSSEWNHDASLDDKDVVVLGNGCMYIQMIAHCAISHG